MQKTDLRREMKETLRGLSPEWRKQASSEIVQRVQGLPQFQAAGCAALFASLPTEPDLLTLLGANGPVLCFPRIADGALEFFAVEDAAHLGAGAGKLREPDPAHCRRVETEEIDFVCVPGLAFDPSNGLRLGRGGGYYDRLLGDPDFAAFTAGICFSLQLFSPLPVEAHDHPVQLILTERGAAGIAAK